MIRNQEIFCCDVNGVSRLADIFAYNRILNKGYIIDTAIRMAAENDQFDTVNLEKKAIYEPCITYLQSKYNVMDIEVIGLCIGARGTISKCFVNFLKFS